MDDLCQFLSGELTHPTGPQQHRQVAVEVRGREERRRLVLNQRLLVRLGRNPEDDYIRIALTGAGIGTAEGVAVGAITGDWWWAAAGAAAGAATGYLVDRNKQAQQQAYDRGVQTGRQQAQQQQKQ